MGCVIAVCGKIGSGKTVFARELQAKNPENTVLLSCDEEMFSRYHHQEGTAFETLSARCKEELHQKAAALVQKGFTVILDWGFWKKEERLAVETFYRQAGIRVRWYLLKTPQEKRKEWIQKRNQTVLRKESSDYFVDDGLFLKCEEQFEMPDAAEERSFLIVEA